MSAAERFQVLLVVLGVLMTGGLGVGGWLLRTLWKIAGDIRGDRDATRQNTTALQMVGRRLDDNSGKLDQLTGHVWQLSERVAAIEGSRGRRAR